MFVWLSIYLSFLFFIRIAANLENLEYSRSFQNLKKTLGKLREFCITSGKNCNKQNFSLTRCSFRGTKMLYNMFVSRALPHIPLYETRPDDDDDELIVLPQITIITITFCCKNLRKSLENSGNLFLLLLATLSLSVSGGSVPYGCWHCVALGWVIRKRCSSCQRY